MFGRCSPHATTYKCRTKCSPPACAYNQSTPIFSLFLFTNTQSRFFVLFLLFDLRGGNQAYGHGGVGMVITALTDNVNRAIAEVKTVWRKHGLKQAAQGSVLFQFEKKGRVEVQGEVDEEQVSSLGRRCVLFCTQG